MTITFGVLLLALGGAVIERTLRWWLVARQGASYSFNDRNSAIGIAGLGLLIMGVGLRLMFGG